MSLKYEFTGETKKVFGRTLHRIRALKNIKKYGVTAGDIGGWIEKDTNLSQDGNAWVYGDARVYGGEWASSPLYIQGTRYSFYIASKAKIGIDIEIHDATYWKENWDNLMNSLDLKDKQEEYAMYFNLAAKRYGLEELNL